MTRFGHRHRRQRQKPLMVLLFIAVVIAAAVILRSPALTAGTASLAGSASRHLVAAAVVAVIIVLLAWAGIWWLRTKLADRRELKLRRKQLRDRPQYDVRGRTPRRTMPDDDEDEFGELDVEEPIPWRELPAVLTLWAALVFIAARLSFGVIPAGWFALLWFGSLAGATIRWLILVHRPKEDDWLLNGGHLDDESRPEAARRWLKRTRTAWASATALLAWALVVLPLRDRAAATLILGAAGVAAAGRAFAMRPLREPDPEPIPGPPPPLVTPYTIWDDKFGAEGKPLAGSHLSDVEAIIRNPEAIEPDGVHKELTL